MLLKGQKCSLLFLAEHALSWWWVLPLAVQGRLESFEHKLLPNLLDGNTCTSNASAARSSVHPGPYSPASNFSRICALLRFLAATRCLPIRSIRLPRSSSLSRTMYRFSDMAHPPFTPFYLVSDLTQSNNLEEALVVSRQDC